MFKSIKNDRWLQWVILILLGVIIVGGFLHIPIYGTPPYEAERNLALIMAGLLGGCIGLPLAIWRSLIASQQAQTAGQGQNADRFQRGAAMLGDTEETVRQAGIFFLRELVGRDAQTYYITVLDLLAAFVRNKSQPLMEKAGEITAQIKQAEKDGKDEKDIEKIRQNNPYPNLPAEIQTAMEAIRFLRKNTPEGKEFEKGWRLDLHKAYLYGADLSDADLSKIDLGGANLSDANLSKANLFGADLAEARLVSANLFGADLSKTDLIGADLGGANLSKANLFGANLRGARLVSANLSKANLSKANLFGANLFGADLRDADLSGANLSYADLSDAYLSKANLSDAYLSGANLSGANLSDADLSDANLSGTIFKATKNLTPQQLHAAWCYEEHEPSGLEDNMRLYRIYKLGSHNGIGYPPDEFWRNKAEWEKNEKAFTEAKRQDKHR